MVHFYVGLNRADGHYVRTGRWLVKLNEWCSTNVTKFLSLFRSHKTIYWENIVIFLLFVQILLSLNSIDWLKNLIIFDLKCAHLFFFFNYYSPHSCWDKRLTKSRRSGWVNSNSQKLLLYTFRKKLLSLRSIVSNSFPAQNKKSSLIARVTDLNIPANHPEVIRGCINTAPSQSKVSSTSPLDDPTTQAQVFQVYNR